MSRPTDRARRFIACLPKQHSTHLPSGEIPIASDARPCTPPAVSSLGGLRTPPPVSAAPPSWGRHPKTFTFSEVGSRNCEVCLALRGLNRSRGRARRLG